MEEKIFELRKKIIEGLRSIEDDTIKVNLKSLNPLFDTSIIELILFDSSDNYIPIEEEVIKACFIADYLKDEYSDKLENDNLSLQEKLTGGEEIFETYFTNKYDFFYFGLEQYFKDRKINKKPYEFYSKFGTPCIDAHGRRAKSKIFALPLDVLKKIDFTEVSFNDFCASHTDFSDLYGVKINPQNVYKKDLTRSIFKGVEFTDSLSGCLVQGAIFTGSKNAIMDPTALYLYDYCGAVFTDVEFTKPFKKAKLCDCDFTGSKHAIIDLKQVYSILGANLQDTILMGNISKLEDSKIIGTKFKGAKLKKVRGFYPYIPIDLGYMEDDYRETDFYGCKLLGVIDSGDIRGASFEGSVGAQIVIGNVIYDSKTNFTDAVVHDQYGREIEIGKDGRLYSDVKEKIDDIFMSHNIDFVLQKAIRK